MLELVLMTGSSFANAYSPLNMAQDQNTAHEIFLHELHLLISDDVIQWSVNITFTKMIANEMYRVYGSILEIKDSKKIVIFKNTINAPYLLLNLAPGKYYFVATYEDVDLHADFELPPESILNIVFNWI